MMSNIWSENKKVNLVMNILLFLLSINFLHYAQITIPLMCVVLLIDNKCKFKVNNMKTFIVLVLFGISFAIFGGVLEIYRYVGLFLPLAYYVGSNIKNPNEDNIKKIIYLVTLGMTCHILLNFACDLIVRGTECFFRNSHLDFWTWGEYPTTQTSVMYIFLIGIIYYIFAYETNKKIKITAIVLFLISYVYSIALGRRTPIFLLVLVVLFSFAIDFLIVNNNSKKSSILILIVAVFIGVGVFIYFIYSMNLFGMQDAISRLGIVRKFTSLGFYSNRHNLTYATFRLAPEHYLGGLEITALTTYGPHDLWLNVFDAAGIVPFVFIVIYSLVSLFILAKVLISKKYSIKFRLLLFGLTMSVFIQFILEPIMTGSSIVLLVVVILMSILERMYLNAKDAM